MKKIILFLTCMLLACALQAQERIEPGKPKIYSLGHLCIAAPTGWDAYKKDTGISFSYKEYDVTIAVKLEQRPRAKGDMRYDISQYARELSKNQRSYFQKSISIGRNENSIEYGVVQYIAKTSVGQKVQDKTALILAGKNRVFMLVSMRAPIDKFSYSESSFKHFISNIDYCQFVNAKP